MAQIQIPEEIATLVDTVAQRYGYDLGRRLTQKEMMKSTTKELGAIRSVRASIRNEFKAYLEEGVDVREKIISLQKVLKTAREKYRVKADPYLDKIRPLRKAVSHLDKVIPEQIERATGEKVIPKFKVSEELMKAI